MASARPRGSARTGALELVRGASAPRSVLEWFHPAVREWFTRSFARPTPAQALGWPPIFEGRSTLLLAPTGSGKTLAAFLAAINRIVFGAEPPTAERLKVVYVSPLKALGVDVERNLRTPIAGIAALAAERGIMHRLPEVTVRSGDTPAAERRRFQRVASDILITTPESLYLLLTSEARERLRFVQTVIVDEIHSLVATKRGAHLFTSLERLERLRAIESPLQRIGLSATQRPLGEVAELLGGAKVEAGRRVRRLVEIVDAGAKKPLSITVEVPIEDMARVGEEASSSIWPSIHSRLVELVHGHRSTMIFANSRRLAERLAAQLNEHAGSEIALAHHGSLARERRLEVEERLKRGELPAIVATSSLELGIDMGAVDLVVQIEAPPSVASGLQRIGRAGHSFGALSEGRIFPKFRGDLLACAAAVERMLEGAVEQTFYPRNPLDVLAQQIVAMAALDELPVQDVYDTLTSAAPFFELSEAAFEGVLDMLSGRYVSDDFAGVRPRITWDRVRGVVHGRHGARRLAVTSGGTIPDRGLYGVFLLGGAEGRSLRVGELDEEMVFESKVGDVFLLGASSWRIEAITLDRVLVSPAPGVPGKMPFWRGDRPGRPVEFGRAIGRLARELAAQHESVALERLTSTHGLDALAAKNLLAYLNDEVAATGHVPSDETIVVERFVDEVGDFRVCLLTPFGARVHAPWAMAIATRYRDEHGVEVDTLVSDDGIVFRIPHEHQPPSAELFFPAPEQVSELVVRGLGATSLFAARFRENAARALLLPRRQPGRRTPLWAQRKRAADLLAAAARHPSFPILVETHRECLRDVFDIPALVALLEATRSGSIRVVTRDTRAPSPFAASLMFSYVANFIYDGDAPLAERRAQSLGVDPALLRDLLGSSELRDLIDPRAIESLERSLLRLDSKKIENADALHDLLLAIGALAVDEIRPRVEPEERASQLIAELESSGRIVRVTIAAEERYGAVEDAARLRDGLGVRLPEGLPRALLEPVSDPLGDLVLRHARTHGPFRARDVAARFGVDQAVVDGVLERLGAEGRLVSGEFVPGRTGREFCEPDVLRALKRKSLAALRKEVEPVDPPALARLYAEWQGVLRPRAGPDALLDAVHQLQGAPLAVSTLDREILPARVRGYRSADLDLMCASGHVLWRGLEPLGSHDAKIALFLADQYELAAPAAGRAQSELGRRVRDELEERGARFFPDLVRATGAFPQDVLAALLELVWAGEVTNDTLAPLRSLLDRATHKNGGRRARNARRSRAPLGLPGTEGRWSLLPSQLRAPPFGRTARPGEGATAPETERRIALANSLLDRYGVVTREAALAEGVAWSSIYEVLRVMEESGRVRRGYFVAGLGATQFARPGAEDRLRALRDASQKPSTLVLSAVDPANPYGAALPWPDAEPRPGRIATSLVLLVDGALVAYLRSERALMTFLPPAGAERDRIAREIAVALAGLVDRGTRRALLVSSIDGAPPPVDSAMSMSLRDAGFVPTSRGYIKRPTLGPRAG